MQKGIDVLKVLASFMVVDYIFFLIPIIMHYNWIVEQWCLRHQ